MNKKRKHHECKYFALAAFVLLTDAAILLPISIDIAGTVLAKAPSVVKGKSNGSFQIPSGPMLLSQDATPAAGHLGAYYFEVMNQSQIWINLNLRSKESGLNPIRLNFTVAFPGRALARAPDMVEVRADLGYFATHRILRPILRFQLGGGAELDLTAKGQTFQYISCSPENSLGPCVSDAIIARITFAALRQIAQSSSVGADALGFSVTFGPEDFQSLRRFIEVVGRGVQIR
jgi:hypothetical protein